LLVHGDECTPAPTGADGVSVAAREQRCLPAVSDSRS
jgi:hypothetical protein